MKRRQARQHLIPFCAYTLPGYTNPQHQILLAEHLEKVESGEIKNLMVFMPPRHLKSETCSIRFPAWCLGRNPQRQFIGCSHTESLQYTFSYAIRETILSPRYQRLWNLHLDKAGAVRWQISGKDNMRDSYIAAGVGGGITGEGADFLIVDDPVKNAEEANSITIRDSIWQWWITTAVTRLQPGGAKIIIMTRWHDDDLAGRLLRIAARDPKADQWTVLHLKAVAEVSETQPDPLGRADGEALWPDKYPKEYLDKVRAGAVDDVNEPGQGSVAFAALYQGEPIVAAGNIVKREWWKSYKMVPKLQMKIHSWDTSFKAKSRNDYSVCTVWGIAEDGYYILDVFRDRLEFPELKRMARALADRDHPSAVLVEDKASGQSLIQEFQRDTALPVLPIKVDSDKISRLNACLPAIESGRVRIPETAHWLYDYIEELSGFPNTSHDDQVDSTTQFLNWVRSRQRPVIVKAVYNAMNEVDIMF